MKLHFPIDRLAVKCRAAAVVLFLLTPRILSLDAAVLNGEWSPVAQIQLNTSNGNSESVNVQTVEIVIPGQGGSATLHRILRPQTGAVWLGVNYPQYCLWENGILGARTVGSKILFKISTETARTEEEVSEISSLFLQSVSSFDPVVSDDDFGVDFLDVFGAGPLTHGRSSMIAQMVAIRNIDWVDRDIGVILSTGSKDNIWVSFDSKLQPWKARFNEHEMLVVDARRITPKAPNSHDWGLPVINYVSGISSNISATIRKPSSPLAFNSVGAEVQFMTCLCEDGRVWFGPSGTDLVFTGSEVVGFFFNDKSPKSLQMFRSSERLPLTRDCRQAYENWRNRVVSEVKAGTYGQKRTIIELSELLHHEASVVASITTNDKILARWISGQIEVSVHTLDPVGVIRIVLALPTLEAVSAEFSPKLND